VYAIFFGQNILKLKKI